YVSYGVGVGVVSAPAYALLARTEAAQSVDQAGAVIPFVVMAVYAMWRVLRRIADPVLAVAGAITFGFGTTIWPVASMALYLHASVALFHVLGIGAFLSDRRRSPLLAGLAFGAATF